MRFWELLIVFYLVLLGKGNEREEQHGRNPWHVKREGSRWPFPKAGWWRGRCNEQPNEQGPALVHFMIRLIAARTSRTGVAAVGDALLRDADHFRLSQVSSQSTIGRAEVPLHSSQIGSRRVSTRPLTCVLGRTVSKQSASSSTTTNRSISMTSTDASDSSSTTTSTTDHSAKDIQRGVPGCPHDWQLCKTTLTAKVVHGFGRGGKMLNMPTANLDIEQPGLRSTVDSMDTGIYFGWAGLRGRVYKTVLSLGWNPVFKNEKKTIEPHILHRFEEDFYGAEIRLMVAGYIRPELPFDSLQDLCEAMKVDCEWASERLDLPAARALLQDSFWSAKTEEQSKEEGERKGERGVVAAKDGPSSASDRLVLTDYSYEPPESFDF